MTVTRETRLDLKTRSPRVGVANGLVVESKTIGTQLLFELETANISRSGMLLRWERHAQVPFLVNTIIEMRIDPHGAMFDAPVTALGKVVRREDTGAKTSGAQAKTLIGVRIVQMEAEAQSSWDNCLGKLEQIAGDAGTQPRQA